MSPKPLEKIFYRCFYWLTIEAVSSFIESFDYFFLRGGLIFLKDGEIVRGVSSSIFYCFLSRLLEAIGGLVSKPNLSEEGFVNSSMGS